MILHLIESFFKKLKENKEEEQQKRYIAFLLSQIVGEKFIRKDLMDEAEKRNVEYEGYVTCENRKEILILRILDHDDGWFAVHLFKDKNCIVEEQAYRKLNAEEAYEVAVGFCRDNIVSDN